MVQRAVGTEKRHPCCIAVDLGANSGRVMAGQLADDFLRLEEISRFTTAFARDAQCGYLSWTIDAIEEQIRLGIGAAAKRTSLVSVGVDSWGVDYVLLDARLERVGAAVCYRDGRTRGTVERVTSRLPAEEIYRKTGIQFQAFNTLYQLAAVAAQKPEWVAKTRHLLMIPDYLHFALSGELTNEYTNATTTQMLNLNGQWDRELFEAAGLPHMWMQPPIDAGTEMGRMHLGNKTISVIAPATHDTASAVVGTPIEEQGEAFLSSGTWSLMGVESPVPFASEQARHWNFSNEGGYGRRYRVLKNIMGLWLLQQLSREFQVEIGDDLLNAAANATPWRSIVNPDDARFLNPASMQEEIRGYCRETNQPMPQSTGEYTRCVLESLALSYSLVKEQLEALRDKKLSRIRIVGGGSRNRHLNQLCSDACQLPVSAGPVEASALGNLCAQLIALGEIGTLEEARQIIRQSNTIDEYQPRAMVPDEVRHRFRQYAAADVQETQ